MVSPVSYRPYTKQQSARIKEMWTLYKDNIGLEGNICLNLVQDGKDLGEIKKAVEEHRASIKENLEAWHGLRKEA
jgi:hypothetical protein